MINEYLYETTTPWDARLVRPRSNRWHGSAAADAAAKVEHADGGLNSIQAEMDER
jgi:hypothetical protein